MTTGQGPAQAVIDEFVGSAHGDVERVRELLAEYPELYDATAAWGETALGAAAHSGRREIAEVLLAAGAPLDLCAAAMLGRIEEVATMLDLDPAQARATGAHGIPVLSHATLGGQREVAELLVARGADPNAGAGGSPPLHGAVRASDAGLVRWLLERGADAGALDYEGKTAWQRAEEAGSGDVAALLREDRPGARAGTGI